MNRIHLPASAPLPPLDEPVRQQIARARLSLNRYREARDRARLFRLERSPHLRLAIAALLDQHA